jgi:hypothetical protein
MKQMKEVILFAAAVLFIASLTATSYAAQSNIGQNPIQRAPHLTSTPEIKPLLAPLMLQFSGPPPLCTVLVDTINNIIQIAHKDLPKTLQLYNNPGVHNSISLPGTWELYYTGGEYRTYVKGCCSENKSFSVQDQQAAGCANSDTVKQCMDKLVKSCINKFKTRDELKAKLMQSQDKANKISMETKQLSDKLNQLTNMMP